MVVTKAIVSIDTNNAIEQSKKDFKLACELFLKNYANIKNEFEDENPLPRGGSPMSIEDLNQFIRTVDGFFKSKLSQLRAEYQHAKLENLKVQRKWDSYIGNVRNSHKRGDNMRINHLMYEIRNEI